MSSPVIYSLTQAQLTALRALPARPEWRVVDALYRKGLVTTSDPRDAKTTDLGKLLLYFLSAPAQHP